MEGKEEGERGRGKKGKLKGEVGRWRGAAGPRLMESWC